MRKIEKDMLKAIKDCRNWQSGNTRVTVQDGVISVYLHGNKIATSYTWEGCKGFAAYLDVCSKWPTATTRSRLRALGIDATIRNGSMHIDGLAV